MKEIKQFLTTRKRNYQVAFGGASGDAVLRDLARFCRADETTFHIDARTSSLLEGRREVWLRIMKHLNLTPDEMVRYFNPQGD